VKVLGGGATANCLVQVSRLGGNASYLGKLGKDWIAEQIITLLQKEGVECSNIIQDANIVSPFNLAVYAGRDWRRVGGYLLPNSLTTISPQDIAVFTGYLQENDWCLLELGEIPLSIVKEFCYRGRKKGVHLVLDVDIDPIQQCGGSVALVKEIFQTVDYIIPNAAALSSLYPKHKAKDLAFALSKEFQAIIIATAGREGCYFRKPGKTLQHQPSLVKQEEIVDTVGAGDAFHGGVLFALASEMTLEQSITMGLYCAAENCKIFGAREGMPYAENID
jgi:sugar/nucleoside kinase (ribokinase family)